MRYTQEPAPEETQAITAMPTVEPRAALRQRPAIACFRCTGNGLYSASGLSLEDIPPGETKNGEIEMLRESLSTPDEQIDEYFDAQVTLTVSYQDTIGKSYLSTSEDNTKIRLAQNSTEGSGGVESHSQKQVLLKNWKMQRAYRTAFREAQEEAKEHFNRCVACERWVCNEDFSPDYGLCVECDRDGKREKRSMK